MKVNEIICPCCNEKLKLIIDGDNVKFKVNDLEVSEDDLKNVLSKLNIEFG